MSSDSAPPDTDGELVRTVRRPARGWMFVAIYFASVTVALLSAYLIRLLLRWLLA
jgi:hypothetical protein